LGINLQLRAFHRRRSSQTQSLKESTMIRRIACGLLISILVLQLTACGTLLHPERRGLQGGKLDADIVLLDAVGLLFFVLPGVIAFAVDLSTGAIYLPVGERSKVNDLLGNGSVPKALEPAPTLAAIQAAINSSASVRLKIDLDPETTWVLRATSNTAHADVPTMLEEMMDASVLGNFPNDTERTWQTLGSLVRTVDPLERGKPHFAEAASQPLSDERSRVM
jgi:hypothetical protein